MFRTASVLTVALLLITAFAAAAETLSLTFSPETIKVEGFTPGGSVIWFGVSRERVTWPTKVTRFTRVTQADQRGSTVLDLDRPVPTNSIWVAVDLFTGAAIGGTPEGYPLRRAVFSAETLGGARGAGSEALKEPRAFLEILLVRPGGGAWSASVGDGGASDADGQTNGVIVLPYANLLPIFDSGIAPTELAIGDRIVAIDPGRMELLLGQAGK